MDTNGTLLASQVQNKGQEKTCTNGSLVDSLALMVTLAAIALPVELLFSAWLLRLASHAQPVQSAASLQRPCCLRTAVLLLLALLLLLLLLLYNAKHG
jgi:hypothetical protein